MVFFTTSRKLIEKQTAIFEKLQKIVKNAVVVSVFYMRGTVQAGTTDEYIHAMKQRMRLTPRPLQARFYKNRVYGEQKSVQSVELDLGTFEGIEAEMSRIVEQMHENFVHEVREINERYVSNQAVNNAVELRKHTLILFFDEPHISLQYKAISALEWLQDDFVFVSVRNPSQTLQKDYFIKKMPAVRGALAALREGEEVEPD